MALASSSQRAGNDVVPVERQISEKSRPGYDDNDGDDDYGLNYFENLPRNRTSSISTHQSASLSRIQSAISTVSQHYNATLNHVRSRNPDQMRPFTHPLSHQKTSRDTLVDFDGPDDAYHPMNWSFRKKAITTFLYGLTTMGMVLVGPSVAEAHRATELIFSRLFSLTGSTWSSAVYSPGITQVDADFHISEEVGVLGVSLLLFGFGLGPLLWAPLSELYGRKPAVLFPYFLAAIFMFTAGSAKDIQTVLISRFFCGFFGSAPVTNTGGVLSDLFPAEERGVAIVGYAMAVVGGPSLGPIVGAAIVQSYLRWRWTEYITGIMMILFLILDIIFVDESYPAILLVKKARRLRYETGNWSLHAPHEEWDVSFAEMVNKYLVVPFQLLGTPICFLIAMYASFVYGILYLSLSSFPIAFIEVRGWSQVVGHLPFLGLLVGVILGAGANLFNQKFYLKKFRTNDRRPVPEARLPPMMVGSVFFSAGLFIFGWTSPPHIPWVAQVIGTVSMGFGFFTVFQAALNYLIDTFPTVSASAVGANTFLRSCFAGAFPLFARVMYSKLGVPWASSLLGFVSLPLIPIPYLFYFYGKRIRARGKWSRPSVYPP
ncbi:polyamine transporter 1 [Histoplasma capsulatum G186AR]|uniref:Polyamine transporter 1 n=2 Tax=Ajellomyces capsulatus TaxID=5037 RepID=C0NJA4_AJECG|nr:polyamine transporter 1 [Histoplasma capsulatum G186AR]EEH07945.1 polyamine transporter 1 [Histoplasma capsulatum G186AR]